MVEHGPSPLTPPKYAHGRSWPQVLSLCLLSTFLCVALLGVWLEASLNNLAALTDSLKASASAHEAFRWWLDSTRNSVVGLFLVVTTSLTLGMAAAFAGAFGPWWVGAGLTRALELTGALPNVILVGLWLVTHRDDALTAVVVVVTVQRTLEVASVVWLALRTLDNERQMRLITDPESPSVAMRAPLLNRLQALLATSAAHGAASLFALQAAVVYLGLAAPDDSTWASFLGRAAREPGSVDAITVLVATVSTCSVTLCLFAVVAGKSRPTTSAQVPSFRSAIESTPEAPPP